MHHNEVRDTMCEYDFSNLKDPFVPNIRWFKRHARFFIVSIIIMSMFAFLTADELTYDFVFLPLFLIFVFIAYKWIFSIVIYKIRIDDNELTIELEKKLIKIRWRDIEHISVRRLKWTGPTKFKIKKSNPDINLPRISFQLTVGAVSHEGKIMLVELLKKIRCYTELKCNKTIQKDIRKWDNEDNSGNL
jgi:hypothetical protein